MKKALCLLAVSFCFPVTVAMSKGDTSAVELQGNRISYFMCPQGEFVIGFKDNVPVCSSPGKRACTAAESDATMIAAEIADYFAIPTHITLGTTPIVLGSAGGPPISGGVSDMTFHALTGSNTAEISGSVSKIVIKVSDGGGHCPVEYQNAHAGWNGAGVYTKTM